MRKLLLPGAAAALVALVVALTATPAGAQFVSQYLGRTFTSNAPSGVNGFACRTDGCRVDLGTGSGDYLKSNGTRVETGADLLVGPNSTTSTVIAGNFNNGNGNTGLGAGTLRLGEGITIGTCSAGLEGRISRLTGTGGTGTLSQTRLCACVSDGAASPVYSWRNLISGTAGNSTTCNP